MIESKAIGRTVLAAISQTFFMNSPVVGLGFLVAVAAFAPQLAAAGLVVALGAQAAARFFMTPANLVAGGAVALNGWFLGLAVAAFFQPGWGLAAAIALGVPLAIVATVVVDRLVSPWQLPLLVAPYVPAFTLLWLALSPLAWVQTVPAVEFAPAAHPLALLGLGTLRGLGQIFFCQNAGLGVAVCAVAAWKKPRMAVLMLAAAAGSEAVAYGLALPAWQIEQGLPAFTSALMVAAWQAKFPSISGASVAIAVVVSPLLEAGVVRLAASWGVFGLSTSYVILVWTIVLLSPTHARPAAPKAWGRLSLNER